MKLKDFYELVIKEGMRNDPRGYNTARKALKANQNKYRRLKGALKSYFDKESLRNPYSDTRILYGDSGINVKRILVGIDVDAAELVMAERLNQKGHGIDLVISHHPKGDALAGLHEVMRMQEDLLVKAGLAAEVAKELMDKRIGEVERSVQASNHWRAVDAARLLNIPFMCVHTAADNCVASYLQSLLEKEKPASVDNLVRLLNKLPEYKEATIYKAGPKIIAGKGAKKTGRILVDMTGGTEGSEDVFARLSQAGIGTLVCMHLSEKHFAKIKSEHINVVIAGHIASDNLGLNLLLDKIEAKAKLDAVNCSGFRRVRRR